jgi:hypothetical protein
MDLYGVAYPSANHLIVVGTGSACYTSADGGQNWTSVTLPGAYILRDVDVAVSGAGVACGNDQTILWTGDFGQTWSVVREGMMGIFYDARIDVSGEALVSGVNSINAPLIGYKPGNGLWDYYDFYWSNDIGTQIEGIAFSGCKASLNTVLCGGRTWEMQAVIARSDPSLEVWTTTFIPNLLEIDTIDIPAQDQIFAIGRNADESSTVTSADNGETWETETMNGAMMNGCYFFSDGTGVAVGENGVIQRRSLTPTCNPPRALSLSVSEGNKLSCSWLPPDTTVPDSYTVRVVNSTSELTGTTTDLSIDFDDLRPDTYTVYVSAIYDEQSSTEISTFTTITLPPPTDFEAYVPNEGTIWLRWNSPVRSLTGFRLYRDHEVCYSGTDCEFTDSGRDPDSTYTYWVSATFSGGYESPMSNSVTLRPVSTDDETLPPMSNLVAYPNPFRDQVAISCSLPVVRQARIAIYDLRGRKVYSERIQMGQSAEMGIRWNGRDEQGARMAPGVYLVRVSAGDTSLTKRVLLLRN